MTRGGALYRYGTRSSTAIPEDAYVTAGIHPDHPDRVLLQQAISGVSRGMHWYSDTSIPLRLTYQPVAMPPERPHD